ncbi:MAG: hypothetical protein KDB07_10985, partial [Planctomycetes bacterium]|nr:hypothetical protein [Planctomycetota bacterium]
LDFLPCREEAYDYCVSEAFQEDSRFRALIEALRSASFRKAIDALPGYRSAESGETFELLGATT